MQPRTTLTAATVLAAAALLGWLTASGDLTTNLYAQDKPAENPSTGGSPILPVPDPPFGGVIGRKANESKPDFPSDVTAPKGAPNVLLVMTDDTGFVAASTFGGPIPTLNFDRVAKRGVKYNRFHTTALCSPTRSCHPPAATTTRAAESTSLSFATGYPGYTSIIPKSVGTIGNTS